jgi:hypothetical protein
MHGHRIETHRRLTRVTAATPMIRHENADAMVLASALMRDILPWMSAILNIIRGWMPLKRTLARTMESQNRYWTRNVTQTIFCPKFYECWRENTPSYDAILECTQKFFIGKHRYKVPCALQDGVIARKKKFGRFPSAKTHRSVPSGLVPILWWSQHFDDELRLHQNHRGSIYREFTWAKTSHTHNRPYCACVTSQPVPWNFFIRK